MDLKKRLLYINDYANNPSWLEKCQQKLYPLHHMWGVDKLTPFYEIHFAQIPKRSRGRFGLVLTNLLIFFRYWDCDIVYSALPGYSLIFLLCKKLHFRRYRIVSIIHHPTSSIYFPLQYDRLVFISPIVFDKYSYLPNAELLFWGSDLSFYNYHQKSVLIEYDFISAGKTYRDFKLYNECISFLKAHSITFGNRNSKVNEISYSDLMKYYNKSKFAVIPIIDFGKNDIPVLSGLTSFLDAVGLGIPLLIADNTLIGLNVVAEGIGLIYEAGNQQDFISKARSLLLLSEDEYQKMKDKCKVFAAKYNYDAFTYRLLQILNE